MWLRQSTASQEISLGQFLDSTDGDTEENGLTIANTDIKLRKGGTTTLANKNSGGATSISNGVYHATLDATDTNTLGMLEIYVHVSGALATKSVYMVLPAESYDALVTNGLNNFDAASDDVAVVALTNTLTTYTGNTPQTADHTASIADIPTVSEFNARTLASADYFDSTTDNVTVGTNNDKTGYSISGTKTTLDALNDFDATSDTVANVTTVATTTTNTDMRGTDGANTVVPPSVAQFEARTRLDADYFSWATDEVAKVALVTSNTDMRGTDGANTVAPDNASITDILADTNELQLNQGNWLTATGFSTSAEIAALNDISVNDILTTQMTESYAAYGIAPTLAQGIFLTMQNLQDFSFAGTTQTVKKINGTSTAATYTLDDAVTPTSKTRAT